MIPVEVHRRLEESLGAAAADALARVKAVAADRGVALFLVGGAVRDLVLGRRLVDLDLAVEGEVEALARAAAGSSDARLTLHTTFGTASVRGADFRLDLARTRRETYERPGALPHVEPASIDDDLARRDFTMNAIALRLTEPFGEVRDPFGGLDDIQAARIRVLHERSFQDDATRMLRAARYASRFGFEVEPVTLAALRRDVAYVDSVSGARVRREFELALAEPACVAAFASLEAWGVLSHVHACLGLPALVARRWRSALGGERPADAALLGYCLLLRCRREEDVESLSRRLRLTAREAATLRDFVRLDAASAKLAARGVSAVEATRMLDTYAPAAVWALGVAKGGRVGAVCEGYLTRWRRVRPTLRGGDLEALGVAPGPAVGETLRRLKDARLAGVAVSRAEEEALVRAWLAAKG